MFSKVQMSMDVRKLLVIHRLNLFWSAKKHLATSGEPRAHILAPRISFKLNVDNNTLLSNLPASATSSCLAIQASRLEVSTAGLHSLPLTALLPVMTTESSVHWQTYSIPAPAKMKSAVLKT